MSWRSADARISIFSILACGLFAIPLSSVFSLTWLPVVVATSVLFVTARRPGHGLVLIACLLPLAVPVGHMLGSPFDSRGAGELLLLPFLTAASVRSASRRQAEPNRLTPGIAASVAVVGAAICVGLAGETGSAASITARCWHDATTSYLTGPGECQALHVGMVWIESLLLALVASRIAGSDAATAVRSARMLMVSAVAASLFAVGNVVAIFLEQPSVSEALAVLRATRIGIHVPDVNAVGSMYALFAVPAFWLAYSWKRWWTWPAVLSLAVALWCSGSRAAVAAACAGVWLLAAFSGTVRVRTLVLGAAAAVAIIAVSLVRFSGEWLSIADAFRIRIHMAQVGLVIAKTHPMFGVGLDRFQTVSRPLLSDEVLALFPNAVDGENSHNNFVQFLAEFGVVGTLALLSVIAFPVLRLASAAGRSSGPREAAGFIAGLIAFLLTCLLGHPFLLPLCVWLYLLVLGLASGMIPGHACRSTRWPEWMAAACVAIAVLSIPGRIAEARSTAAVELAPVPQLIEDHGQLDGVAYTAFNRHMSLYIDPRARIVTMPLRLDPDSPSTCSVLVSMNARRIDTLTPPADSWLRVRYVLRASSPPVASRLDLILRERTCRIRVGQLVIE